MPKLDISQTDWQSEALKPDAPTCLIIRAWFEPLAEMDRFQPTGFPEIGHVIYDAPRDGGTVEKVCIVDSAASMANHLETVCLDGPTGGLHPELVGLPYVQCVTDRGGQPDKDDPLDTLVCTTLTEGHRLASDYFLEGLVDCQWQPDEKKTVRADNKKEKTAIAYWVGKRFRDKLRDEFGIKEVKKDSTYFIWPDAWWSIYKTLFKYDPNSLVHGVLFAKEQIKISRLLTAHLEALGAARVGSSGVKFDRLGKTTSGQPLFAVDEETASSIVATFILDLALLRSYGRMTGQNGNEVTKGLHDRQKRLLLDLAIWKIRQLLNSPFRFRSGCHLQCRGFAWSDNTDAPEIPASPSSGTKKVFVNIKASLKDCNFSDGPMRAYYPSAELFNQSGSSGGPESMSEADEEVGE